MSIEDHPYFDDAGVYRMSEKHLMFYAYRDGFTPRLLNVTIFITQSNKCEVYLSCFEKGDDYGDFKYEFESDQIPETISTFLESISQLEELDFGFNSDYEDYETDCGSQEFLFNHKGEPFGCYFSGGITIGPENFETELGKRFFDLYKFVGNWIEEIYDNFCNDRI